MNVLDKILEELKELKQKHNCDNYDYFVMFFTAISIIEDIVMNLKNNSEDQWNAKTENGEFELLPKKHSEVWITTNEGYVYKGRYERDWFFKDAHGVMAESDLFLDGKKFIRIKDILAWKPYKRMEPYKGE